MTEQTRQLLVDTALDLFQERGYERTTMRAIAERAGVSVGNAYYYFAGKEELIQAFYARSQAQQLDAAESVLATEAGLEGRLRGVLHAVVQAMEPYRQVAGSIFRVAADPASPMSPFSLESHPVREASKELYRRVLDGSIDRLPPRLAEELPDLLWLYSLGIVLFWVHDPTPGATRTQLLIDRSVPLVVRLIHLSRYRMLRGTVDSLLELLIDLRNLRGPVVDSVASSPAR
jgi:AcrR family transcriptional regulator